MQILDTERRERRHQPALHIEDDIVLGLGMPLELLPGNIRNLRRRIRFSACRIGVGTRLFGIHDFFGRVFLRVVRVDIRRVLRINKARFQILETEIRICARIVQFFANRSEAELVTILVLREQAVGVKRFCTLTPKA